MQSEGGTGARRMRRGGAPAVEIAHGDAILASGGEDVWNWSSPAGRVRLRKRVELFVDSLGLRQAHKRVLELGCGTGLYTQQMAAQRQFEEMRQGRMLPGAPPESPGGAYL